MKVDPGCSWWQDVIAAPAVLVMFGFLYFWWLVMWVADHVGRKDSPKGRLRRMREVYKSGN